MSYEQDVLTGLSLIAKAVAGAKAYVGHDMLHTETGHRGTCLDVMQDPVFGLRYEIQFEIMGRKASFWCKYDELLPVAKPYERGCGQTAVALIKAPKHAIYLVPHGSLIYYTRQLARDLRRPDISITVVENAERLHGTRNHILFDHHCFDRHGPRYQRDLDRALNIARHYNGRFE